MIIYLNNADTFENYFTMNVNLEYICDHAGKKDFYYENMKKVCYVPFKVTQAVKILKLIARYGTEQQLHDTSDYLFEHNKQLYTRWERIKK